MDKDEDTQTSLATSILLPAAAVSLYARDEVTLQAARALEDDWRFARIVLHIQEGDVDTAIEDLKGTRSPELIIIQTQTIDSKFTENLENLASYCEEGTSAIVIGPDNDVNLYRKLIDMGVNDYLVRPVSAAVLADIIAKAVLEKMGSVGGSLIAFMGAKGGVGTSALAGAAACGLSEILGQKTVLLDTAGGASNLSVAFGFEPGATLAQAVRAAAARDEESLKRILFKASEKLNILMTGGEAILETSVGSDQLEGLLDMFLAKYPVVIVDLSQSLEALRKIVLARANQVVVVTTGTVCSLRSARSLMAEIKDLRGGSQTGIDMAVNMQGLARSYEISAVDIEKSMDRKISATVPFDAKLFMGCEMESRKLTDDKEARALIEKTLLPMLARTLNIALKEDKGGAAPSKDISVEGILKRLGVKK